MPFRLSRFFIRALALGIAFAVLGGGVSAWAGLRPPGGALDLRDQELTDPKLKIETKSKAKIKRYYVNYFLEFTGPSADFAVPLESFSTQYDYYAPMSLYQTLSGAYAFSNNHRIGIEFGANQPLQKEVLDKYYNYYSANFTYYDPFIFYQGYNLFTNSYSWVNAKFSVDLPLSKFSRETGYYTGFYLGPVWNFRLPNRNFYFSLNLDLYYYLRERQQYFTRFASAVGHTAGYYINPQWSLDTTSLFDFSLVSQGESQYKFTTGSVDRFEVTLRFQPIINVWQFGAFLTSPIYHRTLDRMAVGLNMNVWF